MLANLGDGVIVAGRNGERLYANDEAARLTGFASAEELLASPVELVPDRFEILHADGRPMDESELPGRRVAAAGEAGPLLVRYRDRSGGDERVSEVRAVAIRDGAGEPSAVIHFFRDVTARVAAAAESEALYRQAQQTSALLDSLYASAPIGLGFWDRDLRYVRVNDALARINERSPEEHVGLTFAEVVPQLADLLVPLARSVLEERRPVIARAMSAGTPNDPSARRHWLASYYPVLAPDGEAIGVGAVVEEVTDRRRAEERSALQLGVARVLADAETVADAVPRILETICGAGGWDVGCYWPLDTDDTRLTWVRPGVRLDGFVAMTERSALLPSMIPGRVAETRRAEWLEELPAEGPRASVGSAEGLVSGAAFPIVVDGVVVGVVETFSRTRRSRDAELLDTLSALGGQLGQFISRKRAEEERVGLLARERQARAEAEAAASTLRHLARFSEVALQHSSLDDLLEALLARIVDVLDADTAAVLLVDEADELRVRATAGFEGWLAHARPIPIGAGLAGRVAELRRPLLVPDLAEFELASPVLRERGLNSLVAIPLVVEDRVIGVVHAGSEAYAQFTEDDARLLELIGDRIALAINQAALSDAEREAQNRLQFLGEASALLASSLDVDTTLARVARLVVPHFADWCVVDLVAPDGSVERVAVEHVDPARVVAGRARGDTEGPLLDDEQGIGRVIRTAEPILAERVDDETLQRLFASRPGYLAGLRELGLRSVIVVPLVARGRTLGALTLVWTETERWYTRTDLQLAQELGSRAAVAVDNARLYREAGQGRERLAFLAEASELLGSSLDVDVTLARLAALVASRTADWCAVHVLEDAGARLVSVAHREPEREATARGLLAEMTPRREATEGVMHVLESGEPELYPEVPVERLDEAARSLGVRSTLIVPLAARGRTVGAMSWAWAETPSRYDEADLALALDLGRRAGMAVDNAQLYRQAQERAQAARVLASVGDGVFLIDRHGVIRTWNRAAATATGLRAADVVDRVATEAIPGWSAVVGRIPVAPEGASASRAESLPLDLGERELWLSLHGVAVPDGTVYAFRDLTEERALETMRTEFVSTVSHELRTPLAAIYGAAMTLRRSDVALNDEQRAKMLDVVSGEADRLARTVNDILWASRLDAGSLHVAIQRCDPVALITSVVDAQHAHLDTAHELVLAAEDELPEIAGDPDKVGRVLINLVDNAIKYSPDGGRVEVVVRQVGGRVRFSVVDHGLGIPAPEQRRIFEKFYRLDPNMTRGVGGTGLGLYICRELVRRMDGRIWVESRGLGHGATFHIEFPIAGDFTAHLR